MDKITEEMFEAFDKLFVDEAACGDCNAVALTTPAKTTNVAGNLARRAANDMSNDKKAALGKKAVKKSTV